MENKTLRWLCAVSGRKKWIIALLALAEALHGASGVLYALLLRNIVDAASGRDTGRFWHSALLTVFLIAGQLALRSLIRYLNELGKAGLENVFKQRLLHQLMEKDYAFVSTVHSAEWLNRLTNDAVVVANSMVEILPGLAGMSVKLLCALAMLLVLDGRFAAVLLPGGALLILFTWLFRRVLKRLHKTVQEKDGALRIFLQERLSAMPVLRSYAAGEATERQAAEKMEEHKKARLRKNRFSNLCNVGFGTAMKGMTLFGVLWCGYGILRGTITFGTLTAVTQLIAQIQAPFANITGYLPRTYAMLASAERLMEIEACQDEFDEPPMPPEKILDYYRKRFAAVEVRNAAFAYEHAEDHHNPVLKEWNFKIRKGETVAFCGRSGCGKTSAIKLLLCLYSPDEGERLLIDTSGKAEPLTPAWRRMFAYVPQGNTLMSGTIRENLRLGKLNATDEEMKEVLMQACAGFVFDLPKGLDTSCAESGGGLSEGQAQRIAIARALLRNRGIMLFDEATSALDPDTERQLLQHQCLSYGLERVLVDMLHIVVNGVPGRTEPALLTVGIEGNDINGWDTCLCIDGRMVVGDILPAAVGEIAAEAHHLGGCPHLI